MKKDCNALWQAFSCRTGFFPSGLGICAILYFKSQCTLNVLVHYDFYLLTLPYTSTYSTNIHTRHYIYVLNQAICRSFKASGNFAINVQLKTFFALQYLLAWMYTIYYTIPTWRRPRPSQGPLNVVDLPQSELLARPTLTIKATHSFSRRRRAGQDRATVRRPDDPAIRDKSLLNLV